MTRTTATPNRTDRRNRRRARALGLGLVAVAGLAGASQAAANPALPIPPIAQLTATPNPVLVPPQIVVGPGPLQPVQAIQLGTLVNFSAAGSFDVNGVIIGYDWDLDGVAGFEKTTAGPTTTRRYVGSGTTAVRVRVRDNQGLSSIRTIQLVKHTAPVARAAVSAPVALVGDTITFSGQTSSDDGAIVKYEWDLDGNGTFERTGVQAATSFGAPGTREATLRVTDNHGVTRTTKISARIHERPSAVFTSTPLAPIVNTPTTLDGSSSSDDGSIARYEWDLDGDGTFETDGGASPTTQHTFAATGPATVRLRVTDNDGQTDATALVLQVGDAPAAQVDSLAPVMKPLVRTVKMTRSGRTVMRLRCPVSEQSCTVNLRLVGTTKPVKGKRIGGATRTLAGGRTMNVPVQLGAKAKNRVAKAGALKARAIVRATDQSGNTRTTTTVVTIKR